MSWSEISRGITEEITHLFEVMAQASLPGPLSNNPTDSTPTDRIQKLEQDEKTDPLH